MLLLLLLHSFNGLFPGQPGKAGTRKAEPFLVKPIWIYWSRR